MSDASFAAGVAFEGAPDAPTPRPTFWFVGVTTGASSIMRVFPAWAEHLGLGDVAMRGIDLPLHAPREAYRRVVEYIKLDPSSRGALVTTHKLDLYAACEDLFDEVDGFARTMGETSCLSKRGERLVCHAKDPITSGLAMERFLSPGHFATTGAEAFAMGAGGSGIALTWYLMHPRRGHRPPGARHGVGHVERAARRDPARAPRARIGRAVRVRSRRGGRRQRRGAGRAAARLARRQRDRARQGTRRARRSAPRRASPSAASRGT